MTEWLLDGATKDPQSITADWKPSEQKLIEGVAVREVKNVPKGNGYLTEIYRQEWGLDSLGLAQVFQVLLEPGCVNAWHAHEYTTDRLFVNYGLIRIVLYDGRKNSATYGMLNEFKFGTIRPALVVIPPGVWHGIANITDQPALILNLVDNAYRYTDPDQWRISSDTNQIPYKF